METQENKSESTVCPKCKAELDTLDAKVDAILTYKWNPTTNELTEMDCEEGLPFAFTCTACGEELATNWDDARKILHK